MFLSLWAISVRGHFTFMRVWETGWINKIRRDLMAKTDELVTVVYADFDDARTPVDSWDDFILKMKWRETV